MNFFKPGIIQSKASSNIALVKYWGKKDDQIPQNPSVSFSLEKSCSHTEIHFSLKNNTDKEIDLRFTFEGHENSAFKKRILTYLTKLRTHYPWIDRLKWDIKAYNTFPHSSGIASSASFMASLALIIVKMDELFIGKDKSRGDFVSEVSRLARLGSGSACRSLYGPISLWGKLDDIKNSSDEFAVELQDIHKTFLSFRDTILILDKGQKKISSSQGHELMNDHPFACKRYEIAKENCSKLLLALKQGDLHTFISVVECEALMLHGMMMTSKMPYILMKPQTLSVIEKITDFRTKTNTPVAYTMDAGPNIHLLYPGEYHSMVMNFVKNEINIQGWEGNLIEDNLGRETWSIKVL